MCSLRSTHAPRAPHSRTFLRLTQGACRLSSCVLHTPSTAQVYLTKLRARHVRQHGDHLVSPTDLAEPAGAARDALGDFPFMHAQVLTAVVWCCSCSPRMRGRRWRRRCVMRRRGTNAWAAEVGHVGRVGSRRRRGADFLSSDFCVRASSWGRRPIWRVYSSGSFCASMRMYVRLSVGSARWRVREV